MPSRQQCTDRTIEYEGGYVLHDKKTDTGGLTYAGLTKKWTLDRADKPSDAAKQLWRVLEAEGPDSPAAMSLAGQVYKELYWDPLRLSEMPDNWSLKWSAFDAAVLYGPVRAAKWLQEAVKAQPDGKVGGKTLEAAERAVSASKGVSWLAEGFRRVRLARNEEIVKKKPSQRPNLAGWNNRAKLVADEARKRDGE